MANKDIKCSVNTCRYNDKNLYCTLSDITVGSEEFSPHSKRDTECVSFEVE